MSTHIEAARRQAGYSLVEIMVAMVVTLVVMAGLFSIMIQNQNVYEVESRSADMQQTIRIAMDLMVRQLRHAGRDPTGYAFAEDHQTDSSSCPDPSPAPGGLYTDAVVTAEDSLVRVRADLPVDERAAADPTDRTPDGILSTDLQSGGTPSDGYDEYGDGCINDAGEDVTFEFVAADETLYRTLHTGGTDTTQPIADGIKSVVFGYYTITGTDLMVSGAVPASDYSSIDIIRITIEAEADKRDPVSKKYLTYKLTSEVELRNSPVGERITR
jgi:prepilin-type N-terminal cleavage/methylation domain-containing protein